MINIIFVNDLLPMEKETIKQLNFNAIEYLFLIINIIDTITEQ